MYNIVKCYKNVFAICKSVKDVVWLYMAYESVYKIITC